MKTNKQKVAKVFDAVGGVEHYLEQVLANISCHLFCLDRRGVFLWSTDDNARFLGFKSRNDLVGLSFTEVIQRIPWFTDNIAKWRQEHLEIITTGKPKLRVETGPFFSSTGEECYYLISRMPFIDNEGKTIGVTVVALDISDRKRSEKSQREQVVIERTSGFMQMLAGSIAHELRTPLAIISISADLLQTSQHFAVADSVEGSGLEKHLKSIKHAVKLSSYVIDNMLVMLKTLVLGMKTGDGFKKLSIADSVSQILQVYPFLDHERSLVKVEPYGGKNFFYQGDATLTQHILSNLIRNALIAIKEAGKGEIKIGFDADSKYNILKFTDTALGVAKERLSEIFGYFSSNKQVGAGLGLAFCKKVMKIYGGDIDCRSELGKYTEFSLKFPKS